MVDTAVAVTPLVGNTVSADIIAATGTSVATGNTAVIAAKGETRDLIIVISGDGTHSATVTLETGNEPPSESAGLAVPSGISVVATAAYMLMLTAGQFVKSDDGAVELVVSGTGPVLISAFRPDLTI